MKQRKYSKSYGYEESIKRKKKEKVNLFKEKKREERKLWIAKMIGIEDRDHKGIIKVKDEDLAYNLEERFHRTNEKNTNLSVARKRNKQKWFLVKIVFGIACVITYFFQGYLIFNSKMGIQSIQEREEDRFRYKRKY